MLKRKKIKNSPSSLLIFTAEEKKKEENLEKPKNKK